MDKKEKEQLPSSSTPSTLRTFLAVADGSPESLVAIKYACRRALSTKGAIALLHILEPAHYQHWIGIGTRMREERQEEGEEIIKQTTSLIQEYSGLTPEVFVQEGNPEDVLLHILDLNPHIAILVLAANIDGDSNGPLINHMLSKGIQSIKIPLTIVPGHLTEAEIKAVS